VHRRPAHPWTGEVKARVVGGAGGWTTTLPGKQYSMPGGSIPTSMVAGDAARAVGEATPLLDDRQASQPGPELLPRLWPLGHFSGHSRTPGIPHGWWMDLSGVVHTETIPVSTISSDFSISEVDGACGRYVVFTEFAADWLPGPRSRVRLDVVQCPAWSTTGERQDVDGGLVRMSTDRLTGILRAVVQALVPKLAFYVQWSTRSRRSPNGSGRCRCQALRRPLMLQSSDREH